MQHRTSGKHPLAWLAAFAVTAAALAALVFSSGCQVPSTRIDYDPAARALRIRSPKDVTIGRVALTRSNELFTLEVTNYSATNNSAVIEAVARQNAALLQAFGEAHSKTLNAVLKP